MIDLRKFSRYTLRALRRDESTSLRRRDKSTSLRFAGVAELVDAPDSKSGDGDIVGVRVPPPVKSSRFLIFALFSVCIVTFG